MARINILSKVISLLESQQALPVYVSVPNPEPDSNTPSEFIVLEMTGEMVDEYIDHAMTDIAVQVYANSILSAHSYSIAARDILLNAPSSIAEVAHVTADSMYNWSLNNFKRYQQVAHIYYKLEEN